MKKCKNKPGGGVTINRGNGCGCGCPFCNDND